MANNCKDLEKIIKSKRAKIAVVGLGYVGLPLVVSFARSGFKVLGIDLDKDRVARIKKKQSYITDIPTKDIREIVDAGRFSATDDFKAIDECEVVIICVPTPLKRKYQPDISYIKKAIKSISRNLKKGSLIVLESTTYPGTTEEVILPLLERGGLKHGKDFYLCFSPERIDPGNKIYTLSQIPKVVGGINEVATHLAKVAYGHIINKVVTVSSSRVAETVKLLENTFRIVNIGLIDEMAMMANKMDIDIWEVIEAAKSKPFGFMPFYPGPGVGGHCISTDPLYLYWKAARFGFKSHFIKLAADLVGSMPEYVVARIKQILRKKQVLLNKAKVLVVGVTYKKDIKDLRESPSLRLINVLQDKKVKVSYYDPFIPYLKIRKINLNSIDLESERLEKFDCVIIATNHTHVDYKSLLNRSKLIFDTRNVYKDIKDKKVVKL